MNVRKALQAKAKQRAEREAAAAAAAASEGGKENLEESKPVLISSIVRPPPVPVSENTTPNAPVKTPVVATTPGANANRGATMSVVVTFQSRGAGGGSSNSETLGSGRVLLSSSALKALNLRPGARAIVRFSDRNTPLMLVRVWPHKKTSANTVELATLARVWQDNAESSGPRGDRKITLSTALLNEVRLVPCDELVLRQNANETLPASIHTTIRELLVDAHVQVGLRLDIPLRGASILMSIVDATYKGTKITESPIYSITADTRIVILNSSAPLPTRVEKTSDVTDSESIRLPGLPEGGSLDSQVENLTKSISQHFAGYTRSVQMLSRLVVLGLGSAPLAVTPSENAVPDAVVDIAVKSGDLFAAPKGAIIFGPPGTGKTTLVRGLLAATGVQHVSIDHSLLLTSYQGEAETMLRRAFYSARELMPCVIVMENLDLLCPSRGGASVSDVQKRIVACALSLMDELKPGGGIFVVGTTTKPGDIDAAMRRAGRMDQEIELSVPSSSDHEEILRFLSKRANVTIVDGINTVTKTSPQEVLVESQSLALVAKRAHGMVGSDLLQVIKESFFLATQQSNSKDKDLVDEMSKLSISDKSSPMVLSLDCLQRAVQKVPPSALREVVVEVPSVWWKDIGGMESVKQSLREVIEWPLLHPEWFTSMNVKPLKGVLLYGPPGCSKTLMAKAVATESSMNFLAVRGPELLSKWLGESEKAVQALFRRARTAAPSIIFFDEIDALAGVRGDTSSGVSDRVLSQLLTELDGAQGWQQVIVIAATNRPDMLDPALIRPGRIDRKIYVPPPDAASRESILRLELKKIPLADEVDLPFLIELTEGFSGAEVVAICNEAALAAVERDNLVAYFDDLVQAAKKITPQITDSMLEFYQGFQTKHTY